MTKLGGVLVTEEEKAMILKESQETEAHYQVGACDTNVKLMLPILSLRVHHIM